MRYGIITLTKGGLELAEKIKHDFPESVIYTLTKWNNPNEQSIEFIQGSFTEFVGRIFNKYRILIFIMACGIVVRAISRFLIDKSKDPGIIVLDEKGRFVISLLSGHLGGANEAAEIIAEKIGALPVITTASDVNEKISVDMLAKVLNCSIADMNSAKLITSFIVNGNDVAVVSEIDAVIPDSFHKNPDTARGIIYITNRKIQNINKPYTQLIPKNIIIGIGCKKGTETGYIINCINSKLDELQLDKKSIKCIASIEIKKDERALHEAALHFNTDLLFILIKDIITVEDRFEKSEFVKEKIGVGAVCEPCAYLASNGSGSMILNKSRSKGVTIAIWQEKAPLFPPACGGMPKAGGIFGWQ